MTLNDIARKHKLKLILMHGSQVSGKNHPKSDTDIAIMPTNSKLDILEAYADFAKFYKLDNVDIVDLSTANPLLQMMIARKNKLLLGDAMDYHNFIETAYKKYSDYLPYLKMESDFVRKSLNSYATN